MADFSRGAGPGHRLPDVPLARVLAMRIREGERIEDLATQYERKVHNIAHRLTDAGYERNGEVTRAPKLILTWTVVPDFFDRAACANEDPALFYSRWGVDTGYTARAKRICGGCPVRLECLKWALKNGERYGIWGGLTTGERRQLTMKKKSA